MYMFQLRTAQEARQQHSSKDTNQRGQRQHKHQADAGGRNKPQGRSSNILRDPPSRSQPAPAYAIAALDVNPTSSKRANNVTYLQKIDTSLHTSASGNMTLLRWISENVQSLTSKNQQIASQI